MGSFPTVLEIGGRPAFWLCGKGLQGIQKGFKLVSLHMATPGLCWTWWLLWTKLWMLWKALSRNNYSSNINCCCCCCCCCRRRRDYTPKVGSRPLHQCLWLLHSQSGRDGRNLKRKVDMGGFSILYCCIQIAIFQASLSCSHSWVQHSGWIWIVWLLFLIKSLFLLVFL